MNRHPIKPRRSSGLTARVALTWLCFLAFCGVAIAQNDAFLEYPETALIGTLSAEFRRPLDGCRKVCSERTGCIGYDHSAGMCRMFSGIDAGRRDSGSTAATRTRIPGYPDPANAQPEPVVSWYYAQFTGVDLWGGDLSSNALVMYDVESCERACSQSSSCSAFTLNQARNRCLLKHGFDFVQSFSGGTSGVFFKAHSSQANVHLNPIWELFLDADLRGNDLAEVRASSYLDCLNRCDQNGRCTGFTWVTYTNPDRCYLKRGSGLQPSYTSNSAKGMASARKNPRQVSPDFVRPISPRD